MPTHTNRLYVMRYAKARGNSRGPFSLFNVNGIFFWIFFVYIYNNLTSHFYQLSVVIQETSFILISFGVHTDKTSHIFIEYSEIRLAIELLYSGNYLIAFEPISF